MPPPPRRRSIRLKRYDYSAPGGYFVTICAYNRERLFGNVVAGEMRPNPFGRIVQACWDDLPNHYPHVRLDAFVVMPNHIHGVILLMDDADAVGAGLRPAPTRPAPTNARASTIPKRHGLPEIVRAVKSFSARRISESRNAPGPAIWQRNYYEHIIRNDDDL